ncbi:MAG: ABC transporter permease [Anaerolineae bacterium]|nr:ABC transporter permease [Anaerolineae bacterium]
MRIVFEKRESVSRQAIFLVPILSFLVSLFLGAILLALSGANPLRTYAAMARGAFGSWYNITETLVKAIPLMLTGLGVSIAFRMRFWNIGAEGQLVLGGVAAAWVALFWTIPEWSLLPVSLLVGVIAGALWAGIPASLKAALEVDETLTTLMLNYVAILLYQHLFNGPWRDPQGYGFPGTTQFPQAAWLPRLAGRAHLGLVFALLLAGLLWFVLYRTRWGFELNIIGENITSARYLGIQIGTNIVLALLFSGALSGLAGACEVLGIAHRLQQGLSLDYGYTAIIVAWMAQLNPIAIIFVAILMAAMLVGGDQVQLMMRLPSAVGIVLQGMILIPMLAGSLFTEYKIRVIRVEEKSNELSVRS